MRNTLLFAGVALLFVLTGIFQSWNLSLNILNLALLSAIMAIGVNIQWGWAGLFSAGIVGSVALGGLAVVLVSGKPVAGAWEAGTPQIFAALAFGAIAIALAIWMQRKLPKGSSRSLATIIFLLVCVTLLPFSMFSTRINGSGSVVTTTRGRSVRGKASLRMG